MSVLAFYSLPYIIRSFQCLLDIGDLGAKDKKLNRTLKGHRAKRGEEQPRLQVAVPGGVQAT